MTENPCEPGNSLAIRLKSLLWSTATTLIAVILGGFVTVLFTMVVLESLHTKDGGVTLTVVAAAITLGSITAIRFRRYVLQCYRESLSRSDQLMAFRTMGIVKAIASDSSDLDVTIAATTQKRNVLAVKHHGNTSDETDVRNKT